MEQKVFNFSRHGQLWQNSDDLEGLPQRTIESRTERVFSESIDVHDPLWHAVQPLHDLFDQATQREQDDTRIIAADLAIRAVPITEVDYLLRSKPRTLAILGFDNDIRGDLSLLDTERILFAAAVAVLIVIVVILFVVQTRS